LLLSHLTLLVSPLIIKCCDFSLLNETRKCGFDIFYCLALDHIYLLLPTQLLGSYSRDVEVHARPTQGMWFGIFFVTLHAFSLLMPFFSIMQKPVPKVVCFCCWILHCFVAQVVTVGVVGGSDLVKISEQLGQTG